MPIRLNLLAEQQEAEEARRRDPVKRTIWIGGFLVALMLLWSLYLFLNSRFAASQLKSRERTFAGMQVDFNQATNTLNGLNDVDNRIQSLQSYASNRFLWGTALNALQFSTVDDVQIQRVQSFQEFRKGDLVRTNTTISITAYLRGGELTAPLAGITNKITAATTLVFGDTNTSYTNIEIRPITLNWWQWKTPPPATNSTKVTQEKTPIIRELVRVTLDGKVYGESPIRVADRFKAAILTNGYFARELRRGGVNVISGLDSPTPDEKATNRLSSPFTLECIFKERVRF